MPTTANYGFYSPPLTGVTPNVPRDSLTLANAVDVALKAEETARVAGDVVLSSRRYSIAGTSIAHNTVTTVPFPSSALDEIPWNGTSHYWTVPTAGYYLINAAVVFVNNATGYRHIRININGSFVLISQALPSASIHSGASIQATMKLAASDQVSFSCLQTSGGALVLTTSFGYTFADITRIGLA